jgi:hypothetical protein
MRKGLVLLTLLVVGFVGCTATIEEFDEGTRIATRKFGPSDLVDLGGRVVVKLDKCTLPWTQNMPRLAIIDFRNATDMPGLNKQPFFDVIETGMFDMNKFDLLDYENSKMLLKEAGYQQFNAFDNSKAVELGKALRAKYVMWGDISVASDIGGDGRAIKQYRLSVKITDVATQRIVYKISEAAKLKAVK